MYEFADASDRSGNSADYIPPGTTPEVELSADEPQPQQAEVGEPTPEITAAPDYEVVPNVVSDVGELQRYHNPEFDGPREEGWKFVTDELGLQVAPREQIALIRPEQAVALRERYGSTFGAGYDPVRDTAVIIQTEMPGGPITSDIRNRSAVVHELTHSGTVNMGFHHFFREGLSGMAEHLFLGKLEAAGMRQVSADFVLQRAGVELLLPASVLYLDGREAEGQSTSGPAASSSQGLVAAWGLAHTLPVAGLTSRQIFALSRHNGTEQYWALRYTLDALKLGLAAEVESLPETTDGIIQATSIIAEEARKQGRTV